MGNEPTELLWTIVSILLVLLMQTGFVCRESSLSRNPNFQITKQLIGLGISAMAFWSVGYGIMFGGTVETNYLIGRLFPLITPNDIPFFLFQLMLCSVVVMLISSAVADRLSIGGHMVLAFVISGLIAPFNARLLSSGWLAANGLSDFAGTIAIFGFSGWVLLAILATMGLPKATGVQRNHRPKSVLNAIGFLLLSISWLGFTAGNTSISDPLLSKMIANTAIAGISGLCVGILFSWRQPSYRRTNTIVNGGLAGFIAITASSHLIMLHSAAIVGLISSILVLFSIELLIQRHLNEIVPAIPLYIIASSWGALAVGVFIPVSMVAMARPMQLVIQLVGIVTTALLAFTIIGGLLLVLRRVAPRLVIADIDGSYDASDRIDPYQTYANLLEVLETQVRTGDLSLRAPEEEVTQFGRIAQSYNRVIDKLEQTHQQSKTIVHSAMDGIVTIRQSDLAILVMNPAAETIFGQQMNDLRNVSISALIDLSSIEDARNILAEALRTGQSFQFSAFNFAGAQFPVEAVVSEAVLDDEPVYVATFRDITERHQAQEKLEELNHKLVEASRHQDAFVAAISHELRTPLNAILGMSQALSANVYGEMAPRQRGATEKITESGRHLLELIDDILDLSKMNADNQAVEKHPLPISYICNAALSMVQPQADEKQIRIRTKFDPNVVTVEADARRLKQILINLLNNAIKFTPAHGRVGLMVVGAPSTDEVHFIVWDNGIGIPADRQKDLFKPFVQLDNSPARQYGGVGLGLALVQQLVDLHEGSVSVISKVDEGSRFVVTLPWPSYLQSNQPAAQPMVPELSADLPPFQLERVRPSKSKADRAHSILLADNNEANLSTLSDYLTRRGYKVSIARDGIDTVEKANVLHPDLILLDLQIPDYDGIETIERIRIDHSPEKLPIIALTSRTEPGIREHCLAVGASDFMHKPIGLSQLVQAIKGQLSRATPAMVGAVA